MGYVVLGNEKLDIGFYLGYDVGEQGGCFWRLRRHLEFI